MSEIKSETVEGSAGDTDEVQVVRRQWRMLLLYRSDIMLLITPAALFNGRDKKKRNTPPSQHWTEYNWKIKMSWITLFGSMEPS